MVTIIDKLYIYGLLNFSWSFDNEMLNKPLIRQQFVIKWLIFIICDVRRKRRTPPSL